MRAPLFDILRKDARGEAVWIEAALDVEAAKARVLHLAERFPGDYMIFHQVTARVVANFHFKSREFGSSLRQSTPVSQKLEEKTLTNS